MALAGLRGTADRGDRNLGSLGVPLALVTVVLGRAHNVGPRPVLLVFLAVAWGVNAVRLAVLAMTQRHAPLVLGGSVDPTGRARLFLEDPRLLSRAIDDDAGAMREWSPDVTACQDDRSVSLVALVVLVGRFAGVLGGGGLELGL
jgi:hypothetical protein